MFLASSPCPQPTTTFPSLFRGSQEPGFCRRPWTSQMRGVGRAWGPVEDLSGPGCLTLWHTLAFLSSVGRTALCSCSRDQFPFLRFGLKRCRMST